MASFSVPPEARAPRRLGTVLGGKYGIERLLGVGGMATVYMGLHRNGRRVAIKVLHEELGMHTDVRARFVREGYVANAVDHEGAVRVFDDDVTEDGTAFLVMELLLGESLSERSRRRGDRLPCREVLALGHQLLGVLAAAHAKGIVHRDIKPENLFLTTAGVLKVLDFGIARMKDDPSSSLATATGTRIGTPAYMPSEQALGRTQEIDARTDLWAAGATLFALLAGRTVHVAESAAEVIVITATTPARSLAEFEPELAAPVVAVIDRALQFKRDDRWPSAAAMQRALEEAHLEAFGEPLSPAAVGPIVEPRFALPTARDERETQDLTPARAATEVTLPTPSNARAVRQSRSLDDDIASQPTWPSDRALPPQPPTLDPTLSPATLTARPPRPASADEIPPETRPIAASRSRFTRPLGLGLAALTAVAALVAVAKWPVHPPPAGGAPSGAPVSTIASSTTTGADRACTTNRECLAASSGAPSICRKNDGVCVTLATEQCKVLASPGDLENDATIWIGAMFPTGTSDPTHYGPRSANAVELARRDFSETTGGLLPARAGGPRRPIGVVLCDDTTASQRAAEHLVRDVRVPVILGFALSKEVLDLSASLFVPNGVLALAANTASALRDIPGAPGGPRLVWRVTSSADMIIPADAALMSQLIEPRVRAQRGALAPGEPMRVALVRVANPSGQSYADGFVGLLRFNGKSVAENGPQFRQIVEPERTGPATDRRIAEEIRAFLPHAIAIVGSSRGILPEIENLWPPAARFRPHYIGGTGTVSPALDEHLRKQPELRKRVYRLDGANNDTVAKYVLRYNEVFTPHATLATATPAPYDAFYVFAYAAATLGEEPITGTALAAAIPRLLPPGEPIEVGAGAIYRALYALSAGKSINLQGGMTTLDFDLATGDATLDLAVYCLSPGTATEPSHQVESGLLFRAQSQKLEGTLRCP